MEAEHEQGGAECEQGGAEREQGGEEHGKGGAEHEHSGAEREEGSRSLYSPLTLFIFQTELGHPVCGNG